MKKKILSSVKFFIFLAIGGFLLWLAVRGQDFDVLRENIAEAKIFWVVLSALLGLASHYSRAIRWNLLIQPLGYRPRIANTFMAVMSGYFANLAFPRLGEVSKCAVLKRYEDVPINKLLGTMIVERAVDLISLLIFTLTLFIVEFDLVIDLLLGLFSDKVANGATSGWFWVWILVALVGLAIVALIVWRAIRNTAFGIKLANLIAGFIEGLKTVGQLENKGLFVFHSVLIWVLYYAMSYVVLLAFDATSHLGLVAGLAVFVFGSFGMVAPVQGGIGAYHFMAKEALKVYQIPESNALAFAFVIHGGQTIMVLIAGFISVILLPIYNRNRSHAAPDTNQIEDPESPTTDPTA